jgi:hypothetical protein
VGETTLLVGPGTVKEKSQNAICEVPDLPESNCLHCGATGFATNTADMTLYMASGVSRLCCCLAGKGTISTLGRSAARHAYALSPRLRRATSVMPNPAVRCCRTGTGGQLPDPLKIALDGPRLLGRCRDSGPLRADHNPPTRPAASPGILAAETQARRCSGWHNPGMNRASSLPSMR